VREPERQVKDTPTRFPLRRRELAALGSQYWGIVAVAAILTLARFSEAFLILRAAERGLPLAWIPIVLIAMNIVYAATAYPFGSLSDRFDRRIILAGGFGVLILADIVLALAGNIWMVMAGVGLWGLHMGMTQGLLTALIAGAAPAALRGTAFGLFHLVSGLALLTASATAGILWELVGPAATFFAGAIFTAIGLAGFLAISRDGRFQKS
jgi:MFS family permease